MLGFLTTLPTRMKPSDNLRDRWSLLLGLLVLVVLSSSLRIHHSLTLPRYSEDPAAPYFWTESAFQFRYAQMVAEGRPIPEMDRRAQYPEGMEVRRQLTVGMEYVYGFLFRALRRAGFQGPFHRFVLIAAGVFTSLNLLWVYGFARLLWKHRGAALFAGAVYGVSLAVMERTIGNFLREDFALFFFFGGVYFQCLLLSQSETGEGLKRRRLLSLSLLSAFCLAVALASWHFSRFLYLLFVFSHYLLFLLDPRRKTLHLPFLIATAAALAAGILVPVLREKLFSLSPAMLLSYALVAAWGVSARLGLSPSRSRLVLLALVILILLLFGLLNEQYSHVYLLLFYKLKYLGMKPADPGLLPYDAAVLWVEDFRSPSATDLVYLHGAFLVLSSVGAVLLLRRRFDAGRRAFDWVALYWLASTLVAFVLVDRNAVLYLFFAAAFAGFLLLPARRRLTALGLCAAAAVVFGGELVKTLHYRRPTAVKQLLKKQFEPEETGLQNTLYNNRSLVQWIRDFTAPDAAFLAWMGTSPMILTYAERPILIHSKFESSALREKFKQFIHALYRDEEDLFRFCRRYRAGYFVYQASFALDNSLYSNRYLTDNLQLNKASACYRLHFRPESLERFRLVYQDSFYRVYEVVEAISERPRVGVEEIFNEAAFDRRYNAPVFDDSATPAVLGRINAASDLYRRAQQEMRAGRLGEAEAYLTQSVQLNPNFAFGYAALGAIYEQQGYWGLGKQLYRKALSLKPDFDEALLALSRLCEREGNREEAVHLLEEALERAPQWSEAREQLQKLRQQPMEGPPSQPQ